MEFKEATFIQIGRRSEEVERHREGQRGREGCKGAERHRDVEWVSHPHVVDKNQERYLKEFIIKSHYSMKC